MRSGCAAAKPRMLDVADLSGNPHAREFGEYGVLHVRFGKAKPGSPPKRRSVLTVWDWSAEVLQEWVTQVRPRMVHADSPALWPSEQSARITAAALNARFAAYRDALGLAPGLDLHSLRRSYVTHLIEAGWDPFFVQLLLSPQKGVHDVQHASSAGGNLRGGGGYLRPSITRVTRRFDACAAGVDARLVA